MKFINVINSLTNKVKWLLLHIYLPLIWYSWKWVLIDSNTNTCFRLNNNSLHYYCVLQSSELSLVKFWEMLFSGEIILCLNNYIRFFVHVICTTIHPDWGSHHVRWLFLDKSWGQRFALTGDWTPVSQSIAMYGALDWHWLRGDIWRKIHNCLLMENDAFYSTFNSKERIAI